MSWQEVVRDTMFDALCSAFGLSPDGEGLERFVPAYLPQDNNPQADRNVNVCYIYPVIAQGTQLDYVQTKISENSTLVMEKQIPVTCTLFFYGPDAYADAEKFWSLFLHDYGFSSPRAILRRAGIVPTILPARPTTLMEDEGTLKRLRADLILPLHYYEVEDTGIAVGTVEEVPDLNFQNT